MQKMPSKTLKNTLANAPKTAKDYEQLGRIVASVYETGYLDAAKSYKQSLIKGVFGGVGGVLGATIGVALLLWALSLFNELPLIGAFVDKAEQTIERR